jgi:hypothetical protein
MGKADLAQQGELARGAAAVIVVPQFGAEEPRERVLRRRIRDEAHLPYVFVQLDPAHRIEGDGHPDAYAARTIAIAIANALRPPRGDAGAVRHIR